MDADEYLKEKGRMTKDCQIKCSKCILSIENNSKELNCANFQYKYPEKAVAIVEQWAKEHPVKTYLSVLLEKFPNIPLNSDILPKFCPTAIWGNVECSKYKVGGCEQHFCWNREYKEE